MNEYYVKVKALQLPHETIYTDEFWDYGNSRDEVYRKVEQQQIEKQREVVSIEIQLCL